MTEKIQFIELTADIVATHLANNSVAIADVPTLIQKVHETLVGLGSSDKEPRQGHTPVVSVRASLKPDYIVCMKCGRKQKMLRRHLRTAHGMTREQYLIDYGLPDSYPLTAPNYSARRREVAYATGLGRKKGDSGQNSKSVRAKSA